MTAELNFPSSPSAFEVVYGTDRTWHWDNTLTPPRWVIRSYRVTSIESTGYEGDPSKPLTATYFSEALSPGVSTQGLYEIQTRYVPAGSPSAVIIGGVTIGYGGISLSLSGSYGSTKTQFYGDKFYSPMATGTAPVQVQSTTKCDNLNADYVDGYHAAEANTNGYIPVRNSSGYLFCTIYNMTFGLDNYTADAYVYTQGGDGYMRRKALADVRSEINRTGTYTATVTGVTNVTGATSYTAQWVDFGDKVLVSGRADVNTTGAGATAITIACPGSAQAPSFSAYEEAGGSWIGSGHNEAGAILGNTGSASTVTVSWVSAGAGNKAYGFSFFYQK